MKTTFGTNWLLRGSAIALIAAVMPLGMHFSTDGSVSIGSTPAFAGPGNSGDHGGGNGGDHGGGNGGDHGGGNGHGNGHGKDKSAEYDPTAPNAHGKLASTLKGLNAAHASPTALANAAPNSRVGKIAAYKEAALAAAAAEADAASFGDVMTDVDALASELGIDTTGMSIGEIETALSEFDTSTTADPTATDAEIAAALDSLSAYDPDLTPEDQQLALDDAAAGATTATDDALNAAYSPHSLDDLSEDMQQTVKDAVNDLLGLFDE